MLFAVSGWGADSCSPSNFTHTLPPSPYVNDENVTKFNNDTYYFTALSAGTVTITLTAIQDDNVRFTNSLTACPGVTGGVTTQKITLSSDLDFNVKVYKTTNANDTKTYTLTVTFAPAPTNDYKLVVDSVVVIEGGGNAIVNIRIDPIISTFDSVSVKYTTRNGSASAGSDYTSMSGSITFDSAHLTHSVSVPIIDDTSTDGEEIFYMDISDPTISSPVGSTIVISDPTGDITITDNDTAGLPTLSINDRTVDEGAGSVTFIVTLSQVLSTPVTFTYNTGDNTATQPHDYILTHGTGTIAANLTTASITVPIINDTMAGEGNETFDIVISNPSSNATINDALGVGTITDNDTGLTFAINDAQIAEGDANKTAIIKVIFSMALPSDTNLTYHTADGNATAINDYGALSQTVTMPKGSTSFDINVTIVGDTTEEPLEAFTITLDSVSDGTIAYPQGTVTIFDNDGAWGCSGYTGMLTINEYQNNPNYKDDLKPPHNLANNAGFVPGNYVEIKYLDFLIKQNISGSWHVAIYTTAGSAVLSWDDRDLDCKDPRYAVFEFPNKVMGARGYVVVTDDNGNEVDVLNIDHSDHYAQQCTAFPYDTDFGSSAQNKDLFRDPDGTGDWFDHGSGANSGGSRCINRDGGELLYTEFDAIDIDEPIPTQVLGQISVPVKTKVVNEPFSLRILDINLNSGALQSTNVSIKAYLGSGDVKLPGVNPGLNVNFGGSSSVVVPGFNYGRAVKIANVYFEYCEDINGSASNWNTCWVGTTPEEIAQRRHSISRDTFAIRPDIFDANITNGGIYVAGRDTPLSFKALDGSATPVPTLDYNETQYGSFVVDLNVSNSANCAVKNLTLSPTVVFSDGLHNGNFRFSDIGDINGSIHEVLGAEFALTDTDDTTDLAMRLITPYDVNFTVIPDHFDLNLSLRDHNNAAGLTYLYDFNQTGAYTAMAAHLDFNATAEGDDGNITLNYANGCYAKDTNLTLAFDDVNITPSNAHVTRFLHYSDENGEGNFTLPQPTENISLVVIENNTTIFESNGTARVEYMLNFDRKINLPVNPFMISLNDANLTDGNVSEANPVNILENNATFHFARAKSSKYLYEVVDANSTTTPIAVNVYCDLGLIGCFALGVDTIGGQTNEFEWYLSTAHDGNNDGNITLVSSANGTVIPADPTEVTFTSGINNSVVVRHITATLPDDVDITFGAGTDGWLIYNQDANVAPNPFYRVRFIGAAGWAGTGDTGHVVEGNISGTKNRRLGW
jgi:hypothetical protein